MSQSDRKQAEPARGRLAVLTPGMGAVATTFFAGVEAIRRGVAPAVGAFSEMGRLRVPSSRQAVTHRVRDLLPLAELRDLVFGGWDLFDADAYEAAREARVLDSSLIESLREPLSKIRPMAAVHDSNFLRRLNGPNVKSGLSRMQQAEAIREDIRRFRHEQNCDRVVMVWCASTEVYREPSSVHASLKSFERALAADDEAISPSQIYAYAALKERVPYANGSPNVSIETPAMIELATEMNTPICGSDFKTGQTLLKTVIAPALRNRQLGIRGWFSTNILGNRDGEVLEDPGSFRSKEVSKSGVLDAICSAEEHPELYSRLHHVVRINYYEPRGDNKEGWDNIDLFGWLGYPMQLKLNFLCRDSILAAPIVLDLALFMDLAARSGRRGVQDWLSCYFKAPASAGRSVVEHDFHRQFDRFERELLKIAEVERDPLAS